MKRTCRKAAQAIKSAFLATLGLLAFQQAAKACSCHNPNARDAILASSTVFRATVTAVEALDLGETTVLSTTMVVTEALKGNAVAGREVMVRQTNVRRMGCGLAGFEVGRTELVMVDSEQARSSAGNHFITGICTMLPARRHGPAIEAILREAQDRRRTLEAALREWPGSLSLRLEFGKVLEQVNGPQAARRIYEELVAESPSSLDAHIALVRSLLASGPVPKFWAAWERANALAPGHATLEGLAAQARFRARDYTVLVGRRDFRDWDIGEMPRLDRNLRGADFRNARIRSLNLSGHDLRNARLDGAEMDRLILRNADLRGANLSGLTALNADLNHARLDGARLDGLRLRSGTMFQASLRGVRGEDVGLPAAELTETDLEGARLSKVDLRQADLRGASLNRARLQDADLRQARLDDTDLSGAEISASRLAGATYGCRTRWPSQMRPEALGAVLEGSGLTTCE